MKRIMRAMVVMLMMATLMACEQVDTGHRGVQVIWGKVDMEAGSLGEGLYWYNPISTAIREMDVRTRRWEMKIECYTKDVQQAKITIVSNYMLDPANAHIMLKTVGMQWEGIVLAQAIEGEVKKIVGQYDAVDLIAHRGKATKEAFAAVADSLKDKYITFVRLEMTNIDYLPEFEKAVEDKVIAQQKAVEEKNRTVQKEEQAKQTVIAAKATAESMKIRADALLQNAKLVEFEAVQKWDGKLPQYMFGNSTPFIDIRGLATK